jgi:hypothetical protein
MRPRWNLRVVTICILASAALTSCGDGDSDGCGSVGSTAPCPDPTYGWAQVSGLALNADGTPVASKRMYFACFPDGGENETTTDAEGRFSVLLTYTIRDTVLQPLPPRQPDGSFIAECQGSIVGEGELLGPAASFEIPFGPTEAEIVESEVELRLPGDTPTG